MSATMSSFETANTLSQTTNKSTSLLDKNSGCNGRRNQSFGAPPLAACYVESSKLLLLASWVIFLVPVVNETSISGTWVYACCVIAINNFNGSYLLLCGCTTVCSKCQCMTTTPLYQTKATLRPSPRKMIVLRISK